MPRLRVEQKHDKPYDVELDKEILSIGRSSSNDLVFNHLSLSRHHARLSKKEDKWYVEDSGSRNGTFLNGVRIRQTTPLKSGDMVQLGEITLRFLEPMSDKVQVTDTSPSVGFEATFMIDTDELNLRRYVQEAISSGSSGQVALPTENIWPALNQAAGALITHYPIEKLVEVIMDIVFQAVPAERGALIMLDPNDKSQLQLKVVRNNIPDQALNISRTIINEVMQNQRAILTLDAQSDDRFESSQSIQLQGIRSIICVPLWNNRDVIGLIYIDNLVSRKTFAQSDLRLVALIANMAAVKIENALLLEQQLEKKRIEEQLAVAAQIQRRLLPQLNPDLPNYQIYGINHSCYEIGGDYYDFITKDDGKLAVIIADVAGKGIGAALLMAAFQASLRTLIRTEKDPAAMMSKLNQVMRENSPPNKYITAFYGELDPTTNQFTYVNAGHNPPMHSTQHGVALLQICGPVIGIIPGASYRSESVKLEANDLLFMCTDGITESQDPTGEEFGENGAIQFLTTNRQMNVEDLSQLLEQTVKEFTQGASPIDDSTIIFVKRVA
jgi:serine phosphatase RsbU (regulator of sigma subunit)/pSer/pThr/pTyr-binding forkhead associated (FHA) protein